MLVTLWTPLALAWNDLAVAGMGAGIAALALYVLFRVGCGT
jgi:hypothetical protein